MGHGMKKTVLTGTVVTNTNTPGELKEFLGHAIFRGNTPDVIEAMEKKGQQELVRSEVIPTDCDLSDENLTKLGFELGPVVEGDPIFRRAKLPQGWFRKDSSSVLWSYICDEKERRRFGVFYKAAFYDRHAHMHTYRRFATEEDYEARERGKLRFRVMDGITAIHIIERNFVQPDRNDQKAYARFEAARGEMRNEVDRWLKERYPLHADVMACWD